MFPGIAHRTISGFGLDYKKQVRRFYTAPVGMTVRQQCSRALRIMLKLILTGLWMRGVFRF